MRSSRPHHPASKKAKKAVIQSHTRLGFPFSQTAQPRVMSPYRMSYSSCKVRRRPNRRFLQRHRQNFSGKPSLGNLRYVILACSKDHKGRWKARKRKGKAGKSNTMRVVISPLPCCQMASNDQARLVPASRPSCTLSCIMAWPDY